VSSQLDTLLQRDGAEGINHWGCKVDLSELELLIVPVNQPGVGTELEGGHWTDGVSSTDSRGFDTIV
jgi:Ulp1 family protease